MSEREIKPAGKAADHGAQAPDATEAKSAAPQARDPRAAKWQAVVKSATDYNSAHPDLVAEFLKLAPDCAGDNAGVSVRAVRKWQMDHGLPADGKIGPKTVEAAKKEKGSDKSKEKSGGADGEQKSDVEFSDKEAGTVEGQKGGAGAAPEPAGDIADEAVAGGETAGEEKAEPVSEDKKFEGDTLAHDVVEKAGEDMAGEVPGKAAAKLVLLPRIVSLLQRHDFKGALQVIWDSVGKEDRVELVKAVVEKVGGELSEHALVWFERAAVEAAVVDVLALGWEWTKLGLESIREAHEKGDQKARIRIYAFAWSDTVLRGEHQNAGAITPEEREALKLGIEDGLATREAQPELPFLLLAQYHSEGAARQALELSLMKKAGI